MKGTVAYLDTPSAPVLVLLALYTSSTPLAEACRVHMPCQPWGQGWPEYDGALGSVTEPQVWCVFMNQRHGKIIMCRWGYSSRHMIWPVLCVNSVCQPCQCESDSSDAPSPQRKGIFVNGRSEYSYLIIMIYYIFSKSANMGYINLEEGPGMKC